MKNTQNGKKINLLVSKDKSDTSTEKVPKKKHTATSKTKPNTSYLSKEIIKNKLKPPGIRASRDKMVFKNARKTKKWKKLN